MSKTVVITGATGGLGKEAARAFATAGHSLVLLARDQQELEGIAQELKLPTERILTAVLDVRDREAVRATAEAAVAKFGGVHALIHLVGGWVGGKTLVESSVEDVTLMLDQHVWTTFHLIQAFAPHLMQSRWGRVIVVSASTVLDPRGKNGVYTAAKAAQENLMLTLAAELGEYGVTANIIQVYAIDVEEKGTGTTPKEIVGAMFYLFSDEAAKVSGARIPLY